MFIRKAGRQEGRRKIQKLKLIDSESTSPTG